MTIMNNKDTEVPERIWIQPNENNLRGVGPIWFTRQTSPDDIEFARVDHSAAPAEDKGVRKLTLPELNHLSALLEAERESGEYAGPRGQYYARTERLIKWCNEQIGGR